MIVHPFLLVKPSLALHYYGLVYDKIMCADYTEQHYLENKTLKSAKYFQTTKNKPVKCINPTKQLHFKGIANQ